MTYSLIFFLFVGWYVRPAFAGNVFLAPPPVNFTEERFVENGFVYVARAKKDSHGVIVVSLEREDGTIEDGTKPVLGEKLLGLLIVGGIWGWYFIIKGAVYLWHLIF